MKYNEKALAKDFFNRTIDIVNQYGKNRMVYKEKYYDTTLFINCLFGMVIMPKANWYNKLSKVTIPKKSIQGVKILKGKAESEVNLKELLHCMRNGLGHWLEKNSQNLSFFHEGQQITKVTLWGIGNVSNKELKLEIQFDIRNDGLKKFMEFLQVKINKLDW